MTEQTETETTEAEQAPWEPEQRAWAAREAADTLKAVTPAGDAPLTEDLILLADWVLYGYQDAEVTEETTVEVDGLEEADCIDVRGVYFGAAGLIVDREALAAIYADMAKRDDTTALQDVVDTLEAIGLKVEG